MMMTTPVKDDWVRAAMTDDLVVVDLLVRLKQSQAAPPAKSSVAPLRWGLRLPRTRPMRCDAVVQRKKDGDSTRCSPTTPLSWSCGAAASPSATADGFEDSSPPAHRSPSSARSKGPSTNETTSTTTKRSRKKKTFAELKEEESSLLKERVYLEKEMASLRATFKEQSARNENLKKMKLDLDLHSSKCLRVNSTGSDSATSSQPQLRGASSNPSTSSTHAPGDDHSQSNPFTHKPVNQNNFFILPDLNIMPSEEETETLYGIS